MIRQRGRFQKWLRILGFAVHRVYHAWLMYGRILLFLAKASNFLLLGIKTALQQSYNLTGSSNLRRDSARQNTKCTFTSASMGSRITLSNGRMLFKSIKMSRNTRVRTK
jgi:hypothetical protein